ncbi:sfsA, partial [Symbiodinium microadriaticum]
MRFPAPLIPGRLLKRYKRFLADVELEDGGVVVAHCANPGSMLGLAAPGSVVWLSPAQNPARKLRFSWELVDSEGALVGINTGRANSLVGEALDQGRIPALDASGRVRREVPYGARSRVDFLLQKDGVKDCYLEVKSVTLKRSDGLAEFPDSVTARGARHLEELAAMVAGGHRAVLLFLVQRGDCREVGVARDIDPHYGEALDRARAQGVEVLCYSCEVSPEGVALDALGRHDEDGPGLRAGAKRAPPERFTPERIDSMKQGYSVERVSPKDGGYVIHDEAGFEGMRRAGRLAAETLDMITPEVKPGVTTNTLNQLCHDFIEAHGAVPARRLVEITYESMMRGIEVVKPGATLGDIGH